MFHCSVYSSVIAAQTTGLFQITAVADPIVHVLNLGFQVHPQMTRVSHFWNSGTSAGRSQLQSPRLRANPFPTFFPSNVGTVLESPPRVNDMTDTPLQLDAYEEVDAFVNQTAGAVAQQTLGIVFCDQPQRPVMGDFLHVRWTNATALSALAWTAINPVFDQALQVGTYAIVGGFCLSVSGIAWRVIPASGNVARPGGPMQALPDSLVYPDFRNGGLGQWMTFNSLTPPQIEMFATAADASQQGVLDLIQIA